MTDDDDDDDQLGAVQPQLEDRDVVVDLGAVLLRYAFRDPHNVAALLLLQLQVRVEDAKVELLDEREHIQFDLVLEEAVLQRLLARIVARAVKQGRILGIVLGHRLHLLVVVGPGQRRQTVRIHFTATRIQLGPVVLRQLRAERVDRDDDGTTIGLELKESSDIVVGFYVLSIKASILIFINYNCPENVKIIMRVQNFVSAFVDNVLFSSNTLYVLLFVKDHGE